MIRLLALLPLLLLAGCPWSTLPRTVDVPVTVPCEVAIPKPPVWATQAMPADPEIYDDARLVLVERRQRIAYTDQLLKLLEGCQPLPPK